jgi:hypothetical protein
VRFPATTLGVGLVLSAALTLGACSDSTPTTAVTPTPLPTVAASVRLAALARAGLSEAYTATYALRSRVTRGTVLLRRTPAAYRLDVTVKGKPTAILVHNNTGTYSCQQRAKHKPTCFKVAARGKPIPAIFNAGQQVFFNYLASLARQTSRYRVTLGASTLPHGDVPAGACFAVRPVRAGSAGDVATGTYCLSEEGIPTKVAFASGTFDLQTLGAAPAHKLVPPARATPLPGTGH